MANPKAHRRPGSAQMAQRVLDRQELRAQDRHQ